MHARLTVSQQALLIQLAVAVHVSGGASASDPCRLLLLLLLFLRCCCCCADAAAVRVHHRGALLLSETVMSFRMCKGARARVCALVHSCAHAHDKHPQRQ
ncbi:unnamed protein product [Lampetra planeri]